MLKNTFDRASGRFLFEIYTDSRLKHAHHLNSSIKVKTVEGKQTVSVHFLLIPLFIRTLRKRSQRKSKKKSARMKRVAGHRKWNTLNIWLSKCPLKMYLHWRAFLLIQSMYSWIWGSNANPFESIWIFRPNWSLYCWMI